MRLNFTILLGVLLLGTGGAQAVNIRFAPNFGMGSSSVKGSALSQGESPLSFGASVEYIAGPRITLGLEHQRTGAMKPVSTGVSVSGLMMKWYYLNPAPLARSSLASEGSGSYLFERNLAPYFGAGTGFAQSSLLPEASGGPVSNSVVVYGKARAGLDIPWLDRAGITLEASAASTVAGFGAISMFTVTTGIYFFY